MTRLDEARQILEAFGFDKARTNVRAARTLLALAQLDEQSQWSDATNPMLGVRAILDWIRERLGVDVAENTRETYRRQTLHQFRDAFTTSPSKDPVRVLLTTDAAGEGIDLRAYCRRLVCFDVPFNPSRLEQRIGRIDRYGQSHPPKVFFLMPEVGGGSSLLSGDLEFLNGIGKKVARQKQDLGGGQPFDGRGDKQSFLASQDQGLGEDS